MQHSFIELESKFESYSMQWVTKHDDKLANPFSDQSEKDKSKNKSL